MTERMTEIEAVCECTGPGWCERHQVKKSRHLVELCQRRTHYWQAWEEGRGPGQRSIATDPEKAACRARRAVTASGPGTELRKMLGCSGGCSYIGRMNHWGPARCLEEIEAVIDDICARGHSCSEPVSPAAARRLALLAIARSQAAAESAE